MKAAIGSALSQPTQKQPILEAQQQQKKKKDAPTGDPGADNWPPRSDLRKRSFSLYGTTLALTN